MKTLQNMSAGQQRKVFALMAKDKRVKELYLTMLERPLNELENLMFNQILEECVNGFTTQSVQ